MELTDLGIALLGITIALAIVAVFAPLGFALERLIETAKARRHARANATVRARLNEQHERNNRHNRAAQRSREAIDLRTEVVTLRADNEALREQVAAQQQTIARFQQIESKRRFYRGAVIPEGEGHGIYSR